MAMRLTAVGIAAIVGLSVGTVSAVAVAAATRSTVRAPSTFDIATSDVDRTQTSLRQGDVASARAHLEAAKRSTATCDAEESCRDRLENFNLHARLDQAARRVANWEKQ